MNDVVLYTHLAFGLFLLAALVLNKVRACAVVLIGLYYSNFAR